MAPAELEPEVVELGLELELELELEDEPDEDEDDDEELSDELEESPSDFFAAMLPPSGALFAPSALVEPERESVR